MLLINGKSIFTLLVTKSGVLVLILALVVGNFRVTHIEVSLLNSQRKTWPPYADITQ